jgi:hypothetical protein
MDRAIDACHRAIGVGSIAAANEMFTVGLPSTRLNITAIALIRTAGGVRLSVKISGSAAAPSSKAVGKPLVRLCELPLDPLIFSSPSAVLVSPATALQLLAVPNAQVLLSVHDRCIPQPDVDDASWHKPATGRILRFDADRTTGGNKGATEIEIDGR